MEWEEGRTRAPRWTERESFRERERYGRGEPPRQASSPARMEGRGSRRPRAYGADWQRWGDERDLREEARGFGPQGRPGIDAWGDAQGWRPIERPHRHPHGPGYWRGVEERHGHDAPRGPPHLEPATYRAGPRERGPLPPRRRPGYDRDYRR
jgi:hypothetical protein